MESLRRSRCGGRLERLELSFIGEQDVRVDLLQHCQGGLSCLRYSRTLLTDGLSSRKLTQVTPSKTSRRISLKVVDLTSIKLSKRVSSLSR